MITLLLHLLRLLPFLCGGHRQLAPENLALRHQFAVYRRTKPRPKLRTMDRLFWVGHGQGLGRVAAVPRDRNPCYYSAVAAAPLPRALATCSPTLLSPVTGHGHSPAKLLHTVS